MATRKERYLKHRARAQRRNAKYRRHQWLVQPKLSNPAIHGGGVFWLYGNTGPMADQRLPRPIGGWAYTPPNTAPWAWVISKPGKGQPPHVTITDPVYHAIRDTVGHLEHSHVGYHLRRVTRRGHKLFRMNGLARREMGAFWYRMIHRHWPDWDWQGRRPNLSDWQAGAPLLPDIDWRWGVTGNFPP
jgi:hypothetical protein